MARFGWHELMTSDPEAAKAFYGKVVGWTTQSWDKAPDYIMWMTEQGPIGGVMAVPEEAKAMGAGPQWTAYVGVEDVDGTAAKAETLGGKVLKPGSDLPDGGRFAVLADPQGAVFGVHQGAADASHAESPTGPGTFVWNELLTPDPSGATKFYTELFGWVKTKSVNMGPAVGTYQMFSDSRDKPDIGGIQRPPSPIKNATWAYYALVADMDGAVATIKADGGKVLKGPAKTPSGGRYLLYNDPQGALAAIFSES